MVRDSENLIQRKCGVDPAAFYIFNNNHLKYRIKEGAGLTNPLPNHNISGQWFLG